MTPTILITLIALAASILPQCSDQAVPHTGAQTEQAVPGPQGPQAALAQILAELDSPTDSAGAPPSPSLLLPDGGQADTREIGERLGTYAGKDITCQPSSWSVTKLTDGEWDFASIADSQIAGICYRPMRPWIDTAPGD